MTARDILEVFPDLQPEDIRAALLQAVELVCDKDSALDASDPLGEIIRRAQEHSGLSEDEAADLAVSETRAVRKARASRRGQ